MSSSKTTTSSEDPKENEDVKILEKNIALKLKKKSSSTRSTVQVHRNSVNVVGFGSHSKKRHSSKKHSKGDEEKEARRRKKGHSGGSKANTRSHLDKETTRRRVRVDPEKFRKYCELPDGVKKILRKISVDKESAINNVDLIVTIARFVTEEYPVEKRSRSTTAYASQEVLDHAESVLQYADKPLKKYFKKYELAGKGGFGSVYQGKKIMKKKSIPVAIKILKHDSSKRKANNMSELGHISFYEHRNIVDFYEAWTFEDEMWIITEYLEGGTLSEVSKSQELKDKHIAYVAREVLYGLQFLHLHNIVHRDLKSKNVMLSKTGSVKLIDFGLMADVSNGKLNKLCGSPYWMPPEMINHEPYSTPIDIWSFGVCMMELIISNPPYHESNFLCMYKTATVGLQDYIPEEKTTDLNRDFLFQCFTLNQNERPSAEDLLQHPWVIRDGLEENLNEVLHKIFIARNLISIGLV